jgi:hypothetical protein
VAARIVLVGRAALRHRPSRAGVTWAANKQIAERLVISPKTVGNHVEHI